MDKHEVAHIKTPFTSIMLRKNKKAFNATETDGVELHNSGNGYYMNIQAIKTVCCEKVKPKSDCLVKRGTEYM